MSRHYSSRSYGGYGSSRRRTGADRFGILTFFLLLISSGFLAAPAADHRRADPEADAAPGCRCWRD